VSNIAQNAFDLPNLRELIRDGYIYQRFHSEFPLFVLNYSPKTQYERAWNETTTTCRGLICKEDGEIISRPFKKFFNLGEVSNIPEGPFEITEKKDGSLGISYYWNNQWYIATRGSFESKQAKSATELLQVSNLRAWLNPEHTYLFECVFPWNRIVVNYGGQSALYPLAVVHTESNFELPQGWKHIMWGLHGFPEIQSYNFPSIKDAVEGIPQYNFEGFVIKFLRSNIRIKVKSEEYVRLHAIIAGMNERKIWEALKDNRPLPLENIPNELHVWITQTKNMLIEQYREIREMAQKDFWFARQICETRKEFAEYFQKRKWNNQPTSSILFLMLDDRDYSHKIWDMIKPSGEKIIHE